MIAERDQKRPKFFSLSKSGRADCKGMNSSYSGAILNTTPIPFAPPAAVLYKLPAPSMTKPVVGCCPSPQGAPAEQKL